jgi:DNA-binding beta-propeller fold protein YncE
MTDTLSRLVRRCALPGALLLLAACGSDGDPAPRPQPTRMLVALYGTGELVALSLEDGSVVDTFAPTGWPHAVAVRGDLARAVSVSGDDGTVEEIDLSGATMAATGNETDVLVLEGPFAAAYGGAQVALASYGSGTFSLWTPPDLAAYYGFASGTYLWDVASNGDGSRVFFADYAGQGAIHVVDAGGVPLDQFFLETDMPGEVYSSSSPVALALSPDGARLYVANYDTDATEAADDVMVFDVAPDGTLAFVKRVLLEDADDPAVVGDLYNSQGMVVSPDGSEVWIACDGNGGTGAVAVYQTATDRVDVVPFEGGAHPAEVALDWAAGKAYLPGTDYSSGDGTDEILVVDVATLEVTSIPLPADSDPTGIALF